MKTEITNTYLVFFEIFGKKMKTRVQANSEEEARYMIMGKLIFHKFVKENTNTIIDMFTFLN